MSIFFHIDLDAFFASVEQIDNPSLAGKPVVVGAAPGHRGVVSACSYEARKFGVHSAMPISEAYRLCPEAAFMPVRMNRYAEISKLIMNIFSNYTPDVIRVSIDEASLDMTGTELLWGKPLAAARAMQEAVYTATGLSVSIGIASNRYIAKMASGVQKPHGLVYIEHGDEASFISALPLKSLWGLGKKTYKRLLDFGIDSTEKLLSVSLETLSSIMGKAGGSFLYKVCRGMDPGIYADPKSHSLSAEQTFPEDTTDRSYIEETFMAMSEELSARLFVEGKTSKCIGIKLRYDDFETIQMQKTRQNNFLSSDSIYIVAMALFNTKWAGRPLRLVGLSLSNLTDNTSETLNLFEDIDEKHAKVEKAAIEASMRGLGKITKARLIKTNPKPKK